MFPTSLGAAAVAQQRDLRWEEAVKGEEAAPDSAHVEAGRRVVRIVRREDEGLNRPRQVALPVERADDNHVVCRRVRVAGATKGSAVLLLQRVLQGTPRVSWRAARARAGPCTSSGGGVHANELGS